MLLKNLHDVIWREEKYRQLVGRCTAASYAEGVNVSAGRTVIQHFQTKNF